MKHHAINIIIASILAIILFTIATYWQNDNVVYKCQSNVNSTIRKDYLHLEANITQISSKNSKNIRYSVIGSISEGSNKYRLFRDGNIELSKDGIMRKVIDERINPPDNVLNNLWEENFLPRKYNVEFYQSEVNINDQLVFIRGLSGPWMVCVKSRI